MIRWAMFALALSLALAACGVKDEPERPIARAAVAQ